MTLEEQCTLSYYQEIGRLDEQKTILLVQHSETKRVFVKKVLSLFDEGVFRYLRENPIPNTPRIYEAIRDGDTLIVIEEYVSGPTLKELLTERGVLTEHETAAYALQLCGILQCLHGARPPIIHRDIKPSNIIIAPDGTLKLLDMNAARQDLGAKGSDTRLMGTAGYAAPEQYGFGSSDVRTDIHAVGVLMNVMLTGELPKDRKAAGRLRPVIERCTQMDPCRRYRNVEDLKRALCTVSEELSADQYCGDRDSDTIPFSRQAMADNRAASETQEHTLLPGQDDDAADNSNVRHLSDISDDAAALHSTEKAEDGNPLRFLPPGFRSGKPVQMAAAACGYLFLGWAWFSIEIGSSPLDRLLIRAFFFAATIAVILFTGNYLNVQHLFPLTRSRNKLVKAIGVILWDFILFMAIVIILVIIEDIMGF